MKKKKLLKLLKKCLMPQIRPRQIFNIQDICGPCECTPKFEIY